MCRRFVVRKKGQRKVTMDICVRNGDLVVMGGKMQSTHEHEVPPIRQADPFNGRTEALPGRINITVRAFKLSGKRHSPSQSPATTNTAPSGISDEVRHRIAANRQRALQRLAAKRKLLQTT